MTMRENMVTPKMMDDLEEFWKKYREEHGIGKNIVLMVIDLDRPLKLGLRRVMNRFIDEVMRRREHKGEWELKPALKLKEEDEDESV